MKKCVHEWRQNINLNNGSDYYYYDEYPYGNKYYCIKCLAQASSKFDIDRNGRINFGSCEWVINRIKPVEDK